MHFQIYSFDTLESTNKKAFSYPPYSIILAKNQTNGYGKNNRPWLSLPGNLFVSFVLPDLKEKNMFISFILGLSILNALKEYPLKLKWPNDIMLRNKKIGGILCEQTENKLIAGLGLNLKAAPLNSNMLYPVGALNLKTPPKTIINKIIPFLETNLNILKEKGFSYFKPLWEKNAFAFNETITIQTPNGIQTGIFMGISNNGAMLFNKNEKILSFYSADIIKTHFPLKP